MTVKTVLSPIRFASFVLSVFILSGCASIISKSSYPVTISSSASQAYFVVTDKTGKAVHSGQTPATVTLKSGAGYFSSASYTVTMKKIGFEDKVISIESSMDGWYIANILFGGLIGMLAVDPATGAMWKLPETADGSLDESKLAAKDKELKLMYLDDVDPAIRKKLIRVQ